MSESMDAVFQALAGADRRRMLDIVKATPGCSVNYVTGFFAMSRIAVMKHLRVLERAGLLITQKQGRTRQLWFNAVPIQMIHDRWTSEYSALWAGGMTRVKYRIEARTKRASYDGDRKGGKGRVPDLHQGADRRRLA